MDSVRILKTDISVTSIEKVSDILIQKSKISVAICNSNTLVQCYKNESLNNIINSFSIKCPDGYPVARSSKFLFKNEQKRVDGYNLFLTTIEKGLENNTSHYFFGNTEYVTLKMIKVLENTYPDINIKGFTCPPMLDSNDLNNNEYIEKFLEKRPDILWVSLGFPKQEKFINLLRQNNIHSSNVVGIGAVFEWVAGTKYKAPESLANLGFEWIFRLVQEPKRLLRRYLVDNFLFIIYLLKQYIYK